MTKLIVTKICRTCGQVIDIEVNKIDYDRYKAGLIKVQDAFPYLTADEREMLMTGICGDCYDAMFADYEEE